MKLCVSILAAALLAEVSSATNNTWSNSTGFEELLKTVGVPASDSAALTQLYHDGNSSQLGLACSTAQAAIGTASVDTTPLNQTIVDENWSQTCIQEPYCIVLPEDATDVSKALQIISFFDIKFATRSGGHSPNPGWSSIGSEGILIDLQRFKNITVANDKSYVSVGPGQRWGAVTEYLDSYQLNVIGGRLPDVGVGGLILGGGYHHFSGQFGLAADNVKMFEVVLANGKIVEASSDANSDLFWALKGGGPNFGIVTRYDLYTVPVYEVWCELLEFGSASVHDVLDAFYAWQTDGAADVKSSVALIVSLEAVILGLIYSEPAVLPDAFAPFYNLTGGLVAIPPTNVTLNFISGILESAFPTTYERHDYRGASSLPNGQFTKDVYDYWLPKATSIHNQTGANQTFAVQHVSKNLVQQGQAKGGNPLNLQEEDQQWWTTLIDWTASEDDEVVRSVSQETVAYWEEIAEERALDVDFLFMNDASRDQNPLAKYGTDSLSKLKSIASKYDPAGIFQTQQNNGFLLSKV